MKRDMKGNGGFSTVGIVILVVVIVIVSILGVIFIIASSSVNSTLNEAKERAFDENIARYYQLAMNQYLEERVASGNDDACVVYTIGSDLTAGSDTSKGYAVVTYVDGKNYVYITLYNEDYMVSSVKYGYDKADIQKFTKESDELLSKEHILNVAGCN